MTPEKEAQLFEALSGLTNKVQILIDIQLGMRAEQRDMRAEINQIKVEQAEMRAEQRGIKVEIDHIKAEQHSLKATVGHLVEELAATRAEQKVLKANQDEILKAQQEQTRQMTKLEGKVEVAVLWMQSIDQRFGALMAPMVPPKKAS